MEVQETILAGVKLLKPRVFEDERGFFYESFNLRKFEAAVGRSVDFVQDNHSRSARGVLRGLHYQVVPAAQAKLVRVVLGEVFDVAVDIRRSSPTFGRWVGARLSADNKQQLWIPEGFAHGFLTLSEVAELEYKVSDFYDASADRSIAWNDSDIGVDWPDAGEILLSEKDQRAQALVSAEVFEA